MLQTNEQRHTLCLPQFLNFYTCLQSSKIPLLQLAHTTTQFTLNKGCLCYPTIRNMQIVRPTEFFLPEQAIFFSIFPRQYYQYLQWHVTHYFNYVKLRSHRKVGLSFFPFRMFQLPISFREMNYSFSWSQ